MTTMDRDFINVRFFPPDRILVAEVAVVLGMNEPHRPVACAVELYRAGYARKLLFTGGFNQRLDEPEAAAMGALALKAGIPEAAVLIEPRARHTDENLGLAKAMLGSPPTLLLVTLHVHLRRALIAARKYFPQPIQIGWACYPSRHYGADDWFETVRGRADVGAEIVKIQRYHGVGPDNSCGEDLR